MQYFKGDDLEIKVVGSAANVFNNLAQELTKWFDEAYDTQGLGQILYDNNLMPISRAVAKDIFVKNYNKIIESWEALGSFESYIYLFMQIFGPQTTVDFEILAKGVLKITIQTNQTTLFSWLASRQNNTYVTDHDNNRIHFRTVTGIDNFYEVQKVLDSTIPAGICVQVDFTLIGG